MPLSWDHGHRGNKINEQTLPKIGMVECREGVRSKVMKGTGEMADGCFPLTSK